MSELLDQLRGRFVKFAASVRPLVCLRVYLQGALANHRGSRGAESSGGNCSSKYTKSVEIRRNVNI